MARTAKKDLLNSAAESQSSLLAVVEPEAEPIRPTVKETHRVVRTWAEEKPIEDIDDDDSSEFEDQVDDEPTPSPDDPIAKVLSEIASSRSAWSLQVSRLPNYDRDNRTDPKSRRHSGTLSIPDAEYLKEERYLEDLQAKFARGQNGNWFLLCVRRDNRNFAYLSPVCVEPPLPEVMAAKAVENGGVNPINIYNPQAPAMDGFKQFINQAKQFKEVMEIWSPAGLSQSQTAPAADNGPPTTEQALLTLMNADSGIVDTVASKLRGLLRSNGGSAETERSWIDVLYVAIQNDTLPKLINQFATQFRPQPAVAAPGNAPAAPIQQQLTPDAVAYERLTQVLLNSMRVNGDVMPVLQAVDGFLALFPEHGASVDGFLNAPVEVVMPALAQSSPMAAEVVAMPHAAEWLGKLKAAFFDEGEEPKNDGLQQNA